jgi:(p)ppGpp synthase/HD superfamily hydrolase
MFKFLRKERVSPMDSFVEKARELAKEKHKDQKRKYTGEPYFNHCEEVANILRTESANYKDSKLAIAAAYLHDVLEDTETTFEELVSKVGYEVANLVREVTDVSKPSDGNRKIRKEKDRLHLAEASAAGQSIKLADLMSNSRSIVEHDKDFAKVYLAEKQKLLEVLIHGDLLLFHKAVTLLTDARSHLEPPEFT